MVAIQRWNVITWGKVSQISSFLQIANSTLKMASNVTENGRVAVYIQGFDSIFLIILANLLFEEPRKIRGFCYILAHAPPMELGV